MRVTKRQESRFGWIPFLRCWALIRHSPTGPTAYCGIRTTPRNRFVSPEINSSTSLLVSAGIESRLLGLTDRDGDRWPNKGCQESREHYPITDGSRYIMKMKNESDES